MNKFFSLLPILIVLLGCLGAQIKTPSDKINNIKRIAIIPMESPPLEISPHFSSDYIFEKSTAKVLLIDPTGIGATIAFGIYMLVELPEEIKSSAKIANSIESILDSGKVWIPTVVFANETAKQITAIGKFNVVLIHNVQKYNDLVNRERTFSMQNWLKSIRSWYNEETSPFNYKSISKQKIDGVLEVGICNYGVLKKDEIVLMVLHKLIDPMTGQVLGRSRSIEFQQHNTKEIFDNNAQKFKDVFSELGAKLISKNLKDIGLKPE